MKRWLGIAVAVWVLVLGVGAYADARRGQPTAPEQTTLAQARVDVDEALAQVVVAAGPDTVAALSGYALSEGCRITMVRAGTGLSRAIRLYTEVGGERALLERLAAGLPADFQARMPRPIGTASPALRADADNFVALRGHTTAPGEVLVEAEAGCRNGSDLGVSELAADPTPAERVTAESVLRALAARELRWRAYQVPCPGGGGGVVRTVEATGVVPVSLPKPLSVVVRAVTDNAVPVLSQPRRYAYHDGAAAVAVRVEENVVTISATTTCSA